MLIVAVFYRDNGIKLRTNTKIDGYCPYRRSDGGCEIYPVRPLLSKLGLWGSSGTVNVDFDILPSIGFEPRVTVEDEIKHSLPLLIDYKDNINLKKMLPPRLKGWEKPQKEEKSKP